MVPFDRYVATHNKYNEPETYLNFSVPRVTDLVESTRNNDMIVPPRTILPRGHLVECGGSRVKPQTHRALGPGWHGTCPSDVGPENARLVLSRIL
jgi:hypothetical protein